MRLFLLAITVLLTATAQSQLQKPVSLHRVRYAINDAFKKQEPLKTTQPHIFERAQNSLELCAVTCTPLPVKFLSLKGERKSEETVRLQWETANEINAKGYDVERSLGDAMPFERVGFVAASGNSFNSYRLNDANDYSGISYYRLRQLDNDDKYSYSKTIAVKGFSKEEQLEVYPNPAHDVLQLTLSLTKSGAVRLLIFDAAGRLVQQQSNTFFKGVNVEAVNVQALSPGLYFIRTITPSEKTLALQFIKK